MGTSSSSGGPKGRSPLLPPGIPPLPGPLPALPPEKKDKKDDEDRNKQKANNPTAPSQPPQPDLINPNKLSLPRRFASTRSNLSRFTKTGSNENLQKALGHYTKTSLGGAAYATARMGRTAQTAGRLYNALDSLRANTPTEKNLGFSASSLSGKSPSEISDTIANALQPADGSTDAEAARDSISHAFADLLKSDPQADLLALTESQIEQVVESFVAYDLCNRIQLDVGKTVIDNAANVVEGVERLEMIRQYVKQEVARRFRARANSGFKFTKKTADALAASVLKDTFEVFEEYLK